MYMFDIETLGKSSESVVLSMACIHFETAIDKRPTPQELRDSAFFVKLDAADQIKRLHRKVDKSTVDWWAKQCDLVRDKSFTAKPDDIKLEDGVEMLRAWAKPYGNTPDKWVWARGNLDQLVLDSVEEQLQVDHVFFFNRWRDVRTAVDFLYDTKTGYCDVDYPGFDPYLHIYKHNPIDDCIYDVMMLLYGNTNEN